MHPPLATGVSPEGVAAASRGLAVWVPQRPVQIRQDWYAPRPASGLG